MIDFLWHYFYNFKIYIGQTYFSFFLGLFIFIICMIYRYLRKKKINLDIIAKTIFYIFISWLTINLFIYIEDNLENILMLITFIIAIYFFSCGDDDDDDDYFIRRFFR